MRTFIAVIIMLSLIMFPIISVADTITLKNGRIINPTKCWEDGDLIKCKQHGATVGYQKNDIEQVAPKIEKKKKETIRANKAKSIDLYRIEIAYKIQKAWIFDSDLSNGHDNKVAALAFTVLPNGDVRDITFVEIFGDLYLDESAMNAIINASPFPPHPPQFKQPHIKMAIRFTPNGIR